jgi:hypothetical protein
MASVACSLWKPDRYMTAVVSCQLSVVCDVRLSENAQTTDNR